MKRTLSILALLFLLGRTQAATPPPNIVMIYADDVGYGDLSCYGASKVKTPNLDRLAKGGLKFSNAHATSATCTPSRYSLMTGEYAWRKKGTGVLPGDARLIIAPERVTLPSMLKQVGYATGCVGKWHLGLGDGKVDWNGDIKPGPLEIGFDYCFIIPATGDRVPCVFVENHRVANLDPADPIQVSYAGKIGNEPTGKEHPELLKVQPSHGHDNTIINGISRIGYMSGGKQARWIDEDIADTLTKKATTFIEKNHDHPFFLYFATHDIHVPRVPNPRFVGKSGCGIRGDAVEELDWSAGEVLKTLEKFKLMENTIVIFSSDNGPVIDDGYQDGAVKDLNGHKPAGPLRGGKYSAFDGGTRVPFLVQWSNHIKPGDTDALISQVDLMASFASLTHQPLASDDGPDSLDVLPALLGQSPTARESVVEHAGALSVIKGNWKYIAPSKGAKLLKNTNTETGNDPDGQLFNLADDIGEKNNLAPQNSEKVKELSELLNTLKSDGRSRPR